MDIRSFFGKGGEKKSQEESSKKKKESPEKKKDEKPTKKRKVIDDDDEDSEMELAKEKVELKEEKQKEEKKEEKKESEKLPSKEEKENAVKVLPNTSKGGRTVNYRSVSDAFDAIEATTKRLEIQDILSKLFVEILDTNEDDLLPAVYLCCNQVAPAHHGVEIGVGDSVLTKAITNVTGRTKKGISDKYEEEGDLGNVAMIFKSQQKMLFGQKPKPLTLQEVFDKVRKVASTTSQDQKQKMIEKLLVSATGTEVKYIVRLLQGKLRIGLAEQTVLISLAHAFCHYHFEAQQRKLTDGTKMPWSVTAELKEEAVNMLKQVQSELPVYDAIISACLKPTEVGGMWFKVLRQECHIAAGVPLKPMLAKPSSEISEVLNRFQDSEFTCEYKYDGERAQIHMTMCKTEDGVEKPVFKVYSRNSEDNTQKYPDVIEDIQNTFATSGEFQVSSFILDTEVVAYDIESKALLPFQILSTRARKDVDAENVKVRVIICAFDMLLLNGKSLLETSLEERRKLLREHFHPVDHKFCFAVSHDGKEIEEIEVFLNKAVEDKCEGLMVKALKGPDSFYQPARRSLNWLKLKKDYLDKLADSFDLVPIGAFYGKGKRTGTYGSYILAAYDEENEEFQSVTSIGTGFSDKQLEEFSSYFRNHVVDKRPHNYSCSMTPDVWFSPAQVWEVRAADLSISPVHRAAEGKVDPEKGIALRFPRFLRIRDDKACEDATNATQVAEMYLKQANVAKPSSDMGEYF